MIEDITTGLALDESRRAAHVLEEPHGEDELEVAVEENQ